MRGIISHLLFGGHATDAATYAGLALTIIGTAALTARNLQANQTRARRSRAPSEDRLAGSTIVRRERDTWRCTAIRSDLIASTATSDSPTSRPNTSKSSYSLTVSPGRRPGRLSSSWHRAATQPASLPSRPSLRSARFADRCVSRAVPGRRSQRGRPARAGSRRPRSHADRAARRRRTVTRWRR